MQQLGPSRAASTREEFNGKCRSVHVFGASVAKWLSFYSDFGKWAKGSGPPPPPLPPEIVD